MGAVGPSFGVCCLSIALRSIRFQGSLGWHDGIGQATHIPSRRRLLHRVLLMRWVHCFTSLLSSGSPFPLGSHCVDIEGSVVFLRHTLAAAVCTWGWSHRSCAQYCAPSFVTFAMVSATFQRSVDASPTTAETAVGAPHAPH